MNTTRTFALAFLLLALALLVSTTVALSPAFAMNGTVAAPLTSAAPAVPAAQSGTSDAGTHFIDGLPVKNEGSTETFTVSSGGIDVLFSYTRDADGVVTSEARTWMLLPDEDGYRAYVTEQKDATGEFVEVAKGELYDPDADGVADADDASHTGPRQAASLD